MFQQNNNQQNQQNTTQRLNLNNNSNQQQQSNQIPKSQSEVVGSSFANLRNKDEFLKRSRTSAPTKRIEDVTLLSLRNQCQICSTTYSNDDYLNEIYRTCFNCKERSVCFTHLSELKGINTKCQLCFGVFLKMQKCILAPQTKEEARQQQAITKVQDINNRVNQQQNQTSISGLPSQQSQQYIQQQNEVKAPNSLQQNMQQALIKKYQQLQSQQKIAQEQQRQQELNFINQQLQETIEQIEQIENQQNIQDQQNLNSGLEVQNNQNQQQNDLFDQRDQRQINPQANFEQAKESLQSSSSLSSCFWFLAVIVMCFLIIIQAEIFHANLIPKDQQIIIQTERYENYKNSFKNYFNTHSISQSQDLGQNFARTKELIQIIERGQGHQYQLSIDQIKEEINQHIKEMEYVYIQFPQETTPQDTQYLQLVIQELRKFQEHLDKEQTLRRR
ncbi:UNKNOWN [Stylonychia lemnae]|uniref:Transmembrane protein n=1 Tax=Stylonychia lemnae TaxID=5949 RepID=A0A078AB14_STYLE|nr:UNKNOWN [Stylonychia lemnae]|eukprot:CDW78797.1 UNKNOWN [Stylonychia lemnae]